MSFFYHHEHTKISKGTVINAAFFASLLISRHLIHKVLLCDCRMTFLPCIYVNAYPALQLLQLEAVFTDYLPTQNTITTRTTAKAVVFVTKTLTLRTILFLVTFGAFTMSLRFTVNKSLIYKCYCFTLQCYSKFIQ